MLAFNYVLCLACVFDILSPRGEIANTPEYPDKLTRTTIV